MKTKIKSTSVKVMLSYDYCHFETSMSLENESGVATIDIDNARKECMRLCDKAIKQYKISKSLAAKRSDGKYKMQNFEDACHKIMDLPEGERTVNQIAMLKQYENENWREEFEYNYDYEDDLFDNQ